jgi:hypothetical protein
MGASDEDQNIPDIANVTRTLPQLVIVKNDTHNWQN